MWVKKIPPKRGCGNCVDSNSSVRCTVYCSDGWERHVKNHDRYEIDLWDVMTGLVVAACVLMVMIIAPIDIP